MTQVSKMVADRMKITRVVTRAIEIRGDQIAETVEAALFPGGGEGEAKAFIDALRAALEGATGRLERADIAHALELADDPEHREARDTSEGALRDLLRRTAAVLVGAFDEEAAKKVGLDEALPRHTDQLVQYARAVAGRLNEETLGEPDDLFLIDLASLAAKIHAAADALSTALDDVEREKREAQETLAAREKATEEWNAAYAAAADIFTALAVLAGQERLAEQVRPTANRRRGRTEELDDMVRLEEEVSAESAAPATEETEAELSPVEAVGALASEDDGGSTASDEEE